MYRRFWGHVPIAERYASFDQISGDARFDHLRYLIADYLAIDDYEMASGATEEKAAHYIGAMMTNPRIVRAAVVADGRILADIRHSIALGFISQPYGIFSTLQGARRWVETMQIRRSSGHGS